MCVYSLVYIYVFIFAAIIHTLLAFITVLDQGIIPLEPGSVGIQFFIDIENNHHLGTCRVTSRPKMCCLVDEKDEQHKECSFDTIHDDDMELIKPKNRATLIHVYPTLYQYDQVGYCDFIIDIKCRNTRQSKKLLISIPFDTRLANKKKTQCHKAFSNLKSSDCDSLDEDSLRECEPVKCDLKYSGRRPYFDVNRDKCVSAPACETDVYKKLPDIVYVPISNICRDLDQPFSVGDIYAIRTGLGVVTESTNSTPYDFKVILKSNCSTISENVKMLKDMLFGKLGVFYGDTSDYEKCCIHAIFSILAYIIAICGLVLSLVCCLQVAVWCYVKWSAGQLKYALMHWKLNNTQIGPARDRSSHVNRHVADSLLKEVLVRDLPLEMRESVVDICQRIDREIKQKKRYRVMDLGSQVNLRESEYQSSETSSDSSVPHSVHREKLIKKS